MIKFPSIEQFRNVIRNVKQRVSYDGKDENGDPKYKSAYIVPTLKYRGTVKLHGTNAGVVIDFVNGSAQLSYQSRERELSLIQDNAGFMLTMSALNAELIELATAAKTLRTWSELNVSQVIIYGEWCGGNIQKGVAISGLPKMFVIFAVKLIYDNDEEIREWVDITQFATYMASREDYFTTKNLFCIANFPTWELEIDFNKPELTQNKMIELTEAVEAECPVGKHFGNEGIGEGIVWQCIEDGWTRSDFWFKVKGEKHSASKVKTLAAVDVEAVAKMEDFIAATVTEARLEQGLQNLVNEQLKPFEMQSLGDFIRWVFNDILKEETDTIIANQIESTKIGSAVAQVARKWYIEKFNERA